MIWFWDFVGDEAFSGAGSGALVRELSTAPKSKHVLFRIIMNPNPKP